MRQTCFILAALAAVVFQSCGKMAPMGEKVKEPFSEGKYESNDRYFRSVGKGMSKDDNIAKNKADLQSKKELAEQVGTRMKVVTDQYLQENATSGVNEVNDKFQTLIREVTNTEIADLRKIGEEKYVKFSEEENADVFTVYIAYEIHKRDMYRFMKRQAKLDSKLNDAERKAIDEILDEELKKVEALGD